MVTYHSNKSYLVFRSLKNITRRIMGMSKKDILVIIPARSGSKRIKRKNIRKFLGRPLIVYAIEQAKALKLPSRVVVDTDSPEIAKIALRHGAEVPFLRPAHLATDNSPVADSLLYLLKRLKREEGYNPAYVMVLQTTSPLREKKDIEECWKLMQSTNATTVLTICPTHPRLYYVNKHNNIILANKTKTQSTNMQAWKPAYILNGCFVYIVKTGALLKEKKVVTKRTKAIVCPKWRSIDLDHTEDWVLAELVYKNKHEIEKKIKRFR